MDDTLLIYDYIRSFVLPLMLGVHFVKRSAVVVGFVSLIDAHPLFNSPRSLTVLNNCDFTWIASNYLWCFEFLLSKDLSL